MNLAVVDRDECLQQLATSGAAMEAQNAPLF
jgi:hypothetical protein